MTFSTPQDIDPARYRLLWDAKEGPGPVIYWMSREQRAHDNWGLLLAQQKGLELKRPVMVIFCLTTEYPGATRRHYGFLLRGLAQLQKVLCDYNMILHLLHGNPEKTLPVFLESISPALLISDFDPLRIKLRWRNSILQHSRIPWIEVDGHNIVPCWQASPKREYGAYTLRPKLKKLLPRFLTDVPPLAVHPYSMSGITDTPINPEALLEQIQETSVGEVKWIIPGEKAAKSMLAIFLQNKLEHYSINRNNPCINGQSDLSPYFHFGQLSPQRVAWEVSQGPFTPETTESFLEELIVRRELSDNFCYYTPDYDKVSAFPDWAFKSHDAHRQDKRLYLADLAELEKATTPDLLWNGCQHQLREHGKMHGYLRMYWAKKILEWSQSPEEALSNAIYLNDRYSLDGRDPNGYAGIAWSIGGVHDRPWFDRPIFGKIRYMNQNGCRRKFKVDLFLQNLLEQSVMPETTLNGDDRQ
ncbi:MAG: deoxyribodipyrimidine photo-lyase [Desulfobulbaceae bacterium]|nr:deoxyribodipyrimidine photo-lyase [Desulfobulbaceae bacterium]